MDVQSLSALFATTYNPDPNVRMAAELEIRKVGVQEGAVTAIMQIIGTEGIDMGVRQACSVYLKNRLQKSYFVDPERPRPDQNPIAASDRTALKANILQLLVSAPNRLIRVQLASSLKTLIGHDFPEQWPGFLEAVITLLQSKEPREIYAGLVALLEIVKAYRYRTASPVIPQIAPQIFPILLQLGQQILAAPSTPQSPEFLHLIFKTYKNSIVLQLSEHQKSGESIVPWGQLMLQVVTSQIPEGADGHSDDERERSEWWKAKKWAFSTLNRLFNRYGNPSQLPSVLKKDYLSFANHFVVTFAPEIFKVYLSQVELYVGGKVWISKKVIFLIFAFLTECVKPKSTWKLLKPHFETLVSSFVFPKLCFSAEKKEQWEDDPVDYLRSSIDEYEDYATPGSAATAFLLALATNRTTTTFLPILGFINNILGSNPDPGQKYGALNMTVALGGVIMRHPKVRPSMENFVMSHVLPEFSSPHPFLRAIACETIGTLEKFDFRWTNEQNLSQHFHAVVAALDDTELPVRVHAALALTEMIRHDSVRKALATVIGKVMQDLLKLSDTTDLDVLTSTMEIIVDHFKDELLPIATDLSKRLCESYMRLVQENVANESEANSALNTANDSDKDGEGDKTFAAMGVAKTISTIITSLHASPQILSQIQEIVIPAVLFTLEHSVIDLFDNVYDIVDSLTFNLHSISPSMWPVFEISYKLFKSTAIDFLEEMLPSLDNFISFGKDVFAQRPDYRGMVVDIYTTAMASEHLGEADRVNACKLIESALLNLRGQIDDALPSILAPAVQRLNPQPATKNLRLANLNVLVNAILYNPTLTLQILESQGSGLTRLFFEKWFEHLSAEDGLPRVHDKKLTIVAMCGLLELEPAAIPESLREGWVGIIGGLLGVFRGLPKAVEERQMLQQAFAEEDDEEEAFNIAEEELNLEEDKEDDDVWDEDSAYIEMLAKEAEALRERNAKAVAGVVEDDEGSETSDESINEELGFISPLDTVDPYLAFKRSLTIFQMKNAPGYQAATTSLNVDQQALLIEVMGQAEKKEAEVGPVQI